MFVHIGWITWYENTLTADYELWVNLFPIIENPSFALGIYYYCFFFSEKLQFMIKMYEQMPWLLPDIMDKHSHSEHTGHR